MVHDASYKVKEKQDLGEESEWIARCHRGEAQAFRLLVERYEQMVRSLIRRLIASDSEVDELAQQTFISAYERLGSFGGNAKFSTWLGQIALNKSRDWLRSRRRQATSLEDVDFEIRDPQAGPEVLAEEQERDRKIQSALGRLKDSDRILIVLKYIEGYDYDTVADMLGCSVSAAKVRSLRARDLLKRTLTDMGISP